MLWGLGAIAAALRLFRIQFQLARLRRASHLAASAVQEQALNIRKRLDVRRPVAIRVSDSVSSSFLCGLWNPAILLPEKLAQDLSQPELSALLAHEIAHVRRSDLFWCVGWQWMRALLWFHPLVWKIPAAHNLACEQEADRIASAHLEDRGLYRQLLARLALRVLALPAAETCLALNANSQIARRLNHLEQGKMGVWGWKHSVAAFALVGVLCVTVMGYRLSASEEPVNANATNKFEFKTVPVLVVDEDGKPVQGASITPDGFRVKGGHHADAWGWRKDFGPAEKVVTDQDGKATLKYPVMGVPEEKEYTGALIFSVFQPKFATVRIQDFSVDGTDNPIRLTRGIQLEVSGYFGADHQPVTDIVPSLSQEGVRSEDWQKKENGVMAFQKLGPGGHLIQLMGQLPDGEVVFSDSQFFTAERGGSYQFNLEMKPGIRLEGRIDDSIPRPVKNARVMISMRPKEYPGLSVIDDFYDLDEKYGGRYFWHSYRPIAEDGSFLFESIPPGEVDVTVLGDGFVSKSIGALYNRRNGVLDAKPTVMVIPQAFPLVAPVTKIEVATEPTTTLDITTTTTDGKPIEGMYAGLYPSAFRMKGRMGWLTNSSEEPFRQVPQLPGLSFSGKTDENGKLVLRNIPAEERIMSVDNERYRLPINDRDNRAVYLHMAPGETNVLDLKMEPIWEDFRGEK